MAVNSTFKSHVSRQNFEFANWNVSVQKSHILQSRCTSSSPCYSEKSDFSNGSNLTMCDFCKFEKELELPQLPEMTFASNILKLEYVKGFGIEFNALDALKMVDSKNDLMKVAIAEAWQDSRLTCHHVRWRMKTWKYCIACILHALLEKYLKIALVLGWLEDISIREVVKPFDWTYTTNFKGTLFGNSMLKISQTDEKINIEKLKVKAKILFYEDVILFEDELADNGVAQLSVKMRVMPDSFFVLLRFFLRVDNLMVRIIDTRLYFEENTNYILREFLTKESRIQDLEVSPALLRNPQELWNHLPTVKCDYEKLEFEP